MSPLSVSRKHQEQVLRQELRKIYEQEQQQEQRHERQHRELRAVYEQLEREDERYFAELLFASMPDADEKQKDKGESPVDVPDRDHRLGDREVVGAILDLPVLEVELLLL